MNRIKCIIILSFFISNLLFSFPISQSVIHADSTYTRTYSFETGWYIRKPYELIVNIPTETYEYYDSASHRSWSLTNYVIPDSVGNIPQLIASYTNGGEEEIANAVLSFVQDIGYIDDDYQLHNTLYPIETLVLGGVCDDLSVLYVTLMYTLGFDLIFLKFEDESHVCVGVHLSSTPEQTDFEVSYWTYKNKKYYPAETTAKGWRVGELSDDLEYASVKGVKAKSFPSTLSPAYSDISEYSLDADGDGLSDGIEKHVYGTDPYKADTDGDGLSDFYEVHSSHTDPCEADSDSDSLSDYHEVYTSHTDPNSVDTDGDFWNDSFDPIPTEVIIPNVLILGAIAFVVGYVAVSKWPKKKKNLDITQPSIPPPLEKTVEDEKKIDFQPPKKIDVPSDIASYLTANEKVLQSWKRGSWNIFATNYRIILKKKSFFSKEIVEASYNYISSIEEKISSDVLGGIIFLIIGLTLLYLHLYPPIVFGLYNAMNDPLVSTVFLSTGLLFIGIGSLFLLERKRIFKFHIVGRDPLILPGKLEPMIRWVREYKQSSQ